MHWPRLNCLCSLSCACPPAAAAAAGSNFPPPAHVPCSPLPATVTLLPLAYIPLLRINLKHRMQATASGNFDTAAAAAAVALPLAQPQLQPSPAQRCHSDPLSIALSFLDSADFANAARTCRQWAVASRRKTAWPQLSIAQLADFSVQPGRLLCRGYVESDSEGRPLVRALDDLTCSAMRSSVALSFHPGMSDAQTTGLLQQVSQLPALTFLSLDARYTKDNVLSAARCALLSQCRSLQALRMNILLQPVHFSFLSQLSNLRALSVVTTLDKVTWQPASVQLPPRLEYLTLNHSRRAVLNDSLRRCIEQLLSHPSLTNVHFDEEWSSKIWTEVLQLISSESSATFPHVQELRFRTPAHVRGEMHIYGVEDPGWFFDRLVSVQPLLQLFPRLHTLDFCIIVEPAVLLQLGGLSKLRHLRAAVVSPLTRAVVETFSAHPSLERVQLRNQLRSPSNIDALSFSIAILTALATSRCWHTLAFIGELPLNTSLLLKELPSRSNISAELKAQLQHSPFRFEFWDEFELNRTVLSFSTAPQALLPPDAHRKRERSAGSDTRAAIEAASTAASFSFYSNSSAAGGGQHTQPPPAKRTKTADSEPPLPMDS